MVCIIVASLGGLLILSPLVRNASIQENGALKLVPTDALLIAHVNSWRALLEQQRSLDTLWSILRLSTTGRWLTHLSQALDSLRVENPEFLRTMVQNECYLSWHLIGERNLATLLLVPMTQNNVNAEDVVGALFPRVTPIASQSYAGSKILSFTIDEKQNKQTLHVASKENFCCIASSKILLENALRMYGSEFSLLENEDFLRALQSSSRNVPWNLYLQIPRYAPYIASELNGMWQRLVANLAQWCPWVGLDIAEEVGSFSIQGLSALNTESKRSSNKYHEAKSVPLQIQKILPSTCPVFFRWGDKNPEQLHEQLALKKSGNTRPPNSLLAKAEIQEITLAWDEQNGIGNWLVVLTPRSTSHALGVLRSELTKSGKAGQQTNETLQHLQMEGDSELVIFSSSDPSYFQSSFGLPFPKEVGRYYAMVDRFIVFAGTPRAIEHVALSKARTNTLESTKRWEKTKEGLQSQCNFMYYSAPSQRKNFASLFFSTQSGLRTGRGAMLANSLSSTVIQTSGAGKILFYNAIFQQGESQSSTTTTSTNRWNINLDAPCIGRPIFVTNHNTQAQEILVQDANGKLYLINAAGRILWRAQLEGAIVGEPKQVDLLQNRKLQYVFCTRNKLYAIDRNGNIVAGFPIRLPAPTYAPLAIFDYEGKRDYRFVVACSNRRIYMYDRTGKRVEGFQPPQLETNSIHPLVWFATRGKDYIVACDSNRMYFLNRKGSERFRTKQSVGRALGAPLGVLLGASPQILTVNQEGEFVQIGIGDGGIERIALEQWHSSSYGVIADLDHDAQHELVYTHGRDVLSTDFQGKMRFRTQLGEELSPWLQQFRFSATDSRIGVYSAASKKLWLINSSGAISAGYPLEGTTPFSIGQFTKERGVFNLVTGNGKAVINYEITP